MYVLSRKNIFPLAVWTGSVSHEWAWGRSTVTHTHTHTTHIHHQSHSVDRLIYSKGQNPNLYLYISLCSILLFFSLSLPFPFFYSIYLRPHLIIDSAPGSSFMMRVYLCASVCSCVHLHNLKQTLVRTALSYLHTLEDAQMWEQACVSVSLSLKEWCVCVLSCVSTSAAILLKCRVKRNVWRWCWCRNRCFQF